MGYNFLPSEISAAFALEQIKKLRKNITQREKNFKFLYNYFLNHTDIFDLPQQEKGLRTGWLAFPLLLKNKNKFKRKKLQIYLEKKGIQTRTIFTGNILRQPIMKSKRFKKYKGIFKNSDNVMRNGILIGCHHGLTKKELNYMIQKFKEFIKKFN